MLNSVGLTVLFSVYKFQIIQREDCCVNTITMKKWLQTKILYKEDLDHDSGPSSQNVSRHTPNNVLIIMCNWNVKRKNWKKIEQAVNKKRKYDESYLKFGFTWTRSSDESNLQREVCLKYCQKML